MHARTLTRVERRAALARLTATRRARLAVLAALAALALLLSLVATARPAAAWDNHYRATKSCSYGGTGRVSSWLVTSYTRQWHISATNGSTWRLSQISFDSRLQGARTEFYLQDFDHVAQVIFTWKTVTGQARSCIVYN